MKNTYKIPSKILWGIFGTLFIVLFASFCYSDTVSIVRYELSFADTILHGEMNNFYQKTYDVMQVYNPSHPPTYDLLMNFVLGIWGIPLYIYTRFRGTEDIAGSFSCLLYGKSILLVAFLLSLFLIYKICVSLEISKEKSQLGSFLFLTSILPLSCVGIIGQSDILGIVLTLAGLLAYIKKKNKQFFIWFMFAFSFKQYAFFIFLPLLLLRQKNIVKIFLQTCTVFVFTYLCNLPIKNCPVAYEAKQQFSNYMLTLLTGNRLPFVNGISSAVLLWGMLCLYCYLRPQTSDPNIENSHLIWVVLASILAIFVGFESYSYWYVNIAPFLVIAITYNSRNSQKLLLFETIGTFSLTISNIIKNYWCFDVHNCENMFWDRFFQSYDFSGNITLTKIVTETNLPIYQNIFDAVYVICMIAILWKCWPKNADCLSDEDFGKEAVLRATFNSIIVFIPVVLYLIGLN